jgi:hypothetical protein
MIVESLTTFNGSEMRVVYPSLITRPYEISNHNCQVSTIIENRHLERIGTIRWVLKNEPLSAIEEHDITILFEL